MQKKTAYSSQGDHPVVLRNMRDWLSGTSKDIQTLGELKSVNKNTYTDDSLDNLQTIYHKKRCLERLKEFENLKPDMEKDFEVNEQIYEGILDSSMYSYDHQSIFERWLAYFHIDFTDSHIVELNEIFSVDNKIARDKFTDNEYKLQVENQFDIIVTKFHEAIKHIAEYNTEKYQRKHAEIRKYENTMKAAMYMTLLQYTPEDLFIGGRRKKKSLKRQKKTNKKRLRSKLTKSRKRTTKNRRH